MEVYNSMMIGYFLYHTTCTNKRFTLYHQLIIPSNLLYRATRYAKCRGDSSEDTDGNLKDSFPSFFLHC